MSIVEAEMKLAYDLHMSFLTSIRREFDRLFQLEQKHHKRLTNTYRDIILGGSGTWGARIIIGGPSAMRIVRKVCMQWIIQVHELYDLHPVTTLTSVTYCDRVLSWYRHHYTLPEPDLVPLLLVACVSLAAKIEEDNPPSPVKILENLDGLPCVLDLNGRLHNLTLPQIIEGGYPVNGGYQEMERRVLTQLRRRLHVVTPFDFLPYFLCKLPFLSSGDIARVTDAASEILIDTIKKPHLLDYAPSVLAAVTVLSAVEGEFDYPFEGMACDDKFFEGVDYDTVKTCLEDLNKEIDESKMFEGWDYYMKAEGKSEVDFDMYRDIHRYLWKYGNLRTEGTISVCGCGYCAFGGGK